MPFSNRLSLIAQCERICTIILSHPLMRIIHPQQPKNVTHILWRDINTAEQFKTCGMTDRKITTHPQLYLEALWLFTLTSAGGIRDVNPKQCQCHSTGRFPLDTPISTETTHMLAWRNKCTKQKTKFDDKRLASVLSSSSFHNRLEKSQKNSRGYENRQLSAGDVSCFTGPLQNYCSPLYRST